MNFFKSLIRRIFHYDWGAFELKRGNHHIHVPASICVSEVWVKYREEGRDGCGQQQYSSVRCEPKGRGIDFYVEVNTEKCSIEWFAT